MDALLGALLIIGLRLCDVPIGTLRTVYMVRGDRLRAVPLGLIECLIWVFAISRIMKDVDQPINMVAYAVGFALGTLVGMSLEKWIATGWILVRVVTHRADDDLPRIIRAAGFGVTVLSGEGRVGRQRILFMVTLRRRGKELLDLLQEHDPEAFVTMEPVQQALGGYMQPAIPADSLRK